MLKVFETQCDQCLFSKSRIVSAARKREIVQGCIRKDAHFICHKASINDEDVVCRGFYDRISTNLIRIAGRLNCIEFVKHDLN